MFTNQKTFNGLYWSSTEFLLDPSNEAWLEFFSAGGSSQGDGIKTLAYGVRCSRVF